MTDRFSKTGSGYFLGREEQQEWKQGEQPGGIEAVQERWGLGLRISSGMREVADLQWPLIIWMKVWRTVKNQRQLLDFGCGNCHCPIKAAKDWEGWQGGGKWIQGFCFNHIEFEMRIWQTRWKSGWHLDTQVWESSVSLQQQINSPESPSNRWYLRIWVPLERVPRRDM